MTLLISCKLWFILVKLFPLVLSILIFGTFLTSMNPKDIRAAWELGDRMKTIGEVIAFALCVAFLLACLVNATGVVQIEGFDYGPRAKPMVDQVCR